MQVIQPVFSTLAKTRHTEDQRRVHNQESTEHAIYRKKLGGLDGLRSCELYNSERMRGYVPIETLPKYDRVLVVGAGPSITQEVYDAAVLWGRDATLLTPPIVEYAQAMLDNPGTYVVDSERERFVAAYYYGKLSERVRLVCPTVKHLDAIMQFKSIHHYDRTGWPKSSGAVALKAAFDCMQAKQVRQIGIDCSHHHARFKDEVAPYLDRCEKV